MSYVNPIWAEEQRKRWLRPDWQRWMRGDAHRFAPPSMPETKSQQIDAAFADELDAIRADHERVRQMLAEVKSELAWRQFVRKYSPDQPRVPAGNSAGGQWTHGGPGSEGQGPRLISKPAYLGPAAHGARIAVQKGLEAALALYAWMSSRNTADSTAAIRFRAEYFLPGEDKSKPAFHLGGLTREEAEILCPKREEVQKFAEEAVRERPRADYSNAGAYGSAIHKYVADKIRGLKDPNFIAEVSTIDSDPTHYGKSGSTRLDAFENNAEKQTVCIHELKTGERGTTFADMARMASAAHSYYPGTRWLVFTEVRPTR
jgi:hypothetical protein